MSQTSEEIIEALEAQLKKYEEILEKTLSEPKTVVSIIAGPFEEDGSNYYRAKSGKEEVIVYAAAEPLFGTDPIPAVIKPETEVLVVGQTIIAVVPEKLIAVKELPTFDLVKWEDIGGIKSQVAQLRNAIELPLTNAKLATELGMQALNGVLLHGEPGCGKTLVAQATASTILGATTVDARAFVYIKGAELLSKYVGQTEQDIKNLFQNGRRYEKETGNKAVIFIDEAEALLPRRGSRKSSDVETTIVPTFLSEMSGFEGYNPIVILATNLKDQLDPAITREGRIDLKLEISRPSLDDTKEIFEIHLKKFKTHDTIPDLAEFGANALFGCPSAVKNISGAMVEATCKTAIRHTMSRVVADKKTKERGITLTDMHEAVKTINSSYVTGA